MRILVLSDTHGDFRRLWEIVERHKEDAGLVLFLGDGLREFEDAQTLYPGLKFDCVAGNSDYGSMEKRTALIEAGGKRIFFTHGDSYGVKSSTARLVSAAQSAGAEIALFGHSHCGMTAYEDGLYLMNPGSPSCPRGSKPSYGIIDIVPSGIVTNLVLL